MKANVIKEAIDVSLSDVVKLTLFCLIVHVMHKDKTIGVVAKVFPSRDFVFLQLPTEDGTGLQESQSQYRTAHTH